MSQAVSRSSRGLHRASKGQSLLMPSGLRLGNDQGRTRVRVPRSSSGHMDSACAARARMGRTIMSSWPEFDITCACHRG